MRHERIWAGTPIVLLGWSGSGNDSRKGKYQLLDAIVALFNGFMAVLKLDG